MTCQSFEFTNDLRNIGHDWSTLTRVELKNIGVWVTTISEGTAVLSLFLLLQITIVFMRIWHFVIQC